MSDDGNATAAQGPFEWSDDRGGFKLERRGQGVVLVMARGHAGADLGGKLAGALDERLRATGQHVFLDVGEITSYHPEVRTELTRVLLSHRGRLLSLHVLAMSRLVRMGAAVTSLVIPKLQSYGDRGQFLSALNAALRRPEA